MPNATRRAGRSVGRPRAQRVTWTLRLYVAGQTVRSLRALENLTALCKEYLVGRYNIEVIDLLRDPQLARGDQIVAVPTLVRRRPRPLRRVVGDLSQTDRVLIGLDLRPRVPAPAVGPEGRP